MTEEKGKVRFRFNKTPEYKIISANGAYGGMTPRGTFLLHFFNEYAPIPVAEVVDIDEKGTIKKAQPIRDQGDVEFGKPVYVRDLVIGISMPPEQAVSLANFILERVKMVQDQDKGDQEAP